MQIGLEDLRLVATLKILILLIGELFEDHSLPIY